MNDFVLIVD